MEGPGQSRLQLPSVPSSKLPFLQFLWLFEWMSRLLESSFKIP